MHPPRYTLALRILHWLLAVLILGLIAVGWTMKEVKGLGPLRGDLYSLHKSFGVMALTLIFLRIAVRMVAPSPPLPSTLPAMERRLAHVGHLLLYLGMIFVPLSGFVMSMAGGHGIKFFGAPLPTLMATDKPLASLAHEVHELLPYLLLGVIALHVAGALKHRFFDIPENDVLPRMGLPGKKGLTPPPPSA